MAMAYATQEEVVAALRAIGEPDLAHRLERCMTARRERRGGDGWPFSCRSSACVWCRRPMIRSWWNGMCQWTAEATMWSVAIMRIDPSAGLPDACDRACCPPAGLSRSGIRRSWTPRKVEMRLEVGMASQSAQKPSPATLSPRPAGRWDKDRCSTPPIADLCPDGDGGACRTVPTSVARSKAEPADGALPVVPSRRRGRTASVSDFVEWWKPGWRDR